MRERSMGAIALKSLGRSDRAVAKQIGVEYGAISDWTTGEAKPSKQMRERLFKELGIPQKSWDEIPSKTKRAPSKATIAAVASDANNPVLRRIYALEEMVQELLDIVLDDPSVTMLERSKVMSTLATTMGTIRKLKGEDIIEFKVTKHPKWVMLRGKILGALTNYPDALEAVVEAIKPTEDEESA